MLSKENMNLDFTSLASFTKIFIDTLNKHAPINEKYIHANHANFITKGLRKAIMLRSRLPNIFLNMEFKKAYNKHRNLCVKMVKKAKKEHFQNISLSEITDNKKFWKTVSPLFGNKVKTNQKINLIANNALVISDVEIAKTFKEYLDEIVPKPNIIQNEYYIRKTGNIEDPVKKASFKYQYHPSITNIKDIMKSKNISSFSFQPVSIDKVKDIIKTLNTKKACPDRDIPVKLIKMNEDIFSRLISQNFNQSLVNGEFPHCLKQTKVIPVFKKRKNLTNPIIAFYQ